MMGDPLFLFNNDTGDATGQTFVLNHSALPQWTGRLDDTVSVRTLMLYLAILTPIS